MASCGGDDTTVVCTLLQPAVIQPVDRSAKNVNLSGLGMIDKPHSKNTPLQSERRQEMDANNEYCHLLQE